MGNTTTTTAADAVRDSAAAEPSAPAVRASTTWAASPVLCVSGTCKNGGQSNDAEDFDF
jgi:hypothetical protein